MEEDIKRIESLLTPKFNRTCKTGIYRQDGRRKSPKRWMKVASMAAIFIVAFVVGIVAFKPADINAEEVVKTSLSKLSKADTYKVAFNVLAKPCATDEIYKIDPNGEKISGMMYVKYVDKIPKIRFEWADPEQTVVVYDGKNYMRYKNGNLIEKHKASPIFDLKELTALSAAELHFDKYMRDADRQVITDGNKIAVTVKLKELVLSGEFSSDDKSLRKATALYNDIKIVETDFIEYGMELNDTLFE